MLGREMMIHASEAYFKKKRKFADKLTSSHPVFGIRISQKHIFKPFIGQLKTVLKLVKINKILTMEDLI